ncbi:hypothetical protein ACNF49_31045 [Actinomadura sp. ATCC 39365]
MRRPARRQLSADTLGSRRATARSTHEPAASGAPATSKGPSWKASRWSCRGRPALGAQRGLGAVIDWSWQLLSDDERTVAERVSILPGGVTPASAAAVCAGTAVRADEIPELLAALVDRSLLQLAPDPGRYRMLETLREYGADRLAGTGDLGTVRDLAALRRRCDSGDARGAVALALSLTWYWQMFGRHRDAAYWLGEALAVPSGGADARTRLRSGDLPGQPGRHPAGDDRRGGRRRPGADT